MRGRPALGAVVLAPVVPAAAVGALPAGDVQLGAVWSQPRTVRVSRR